MARGDLTLFQEFEEYAQENFAGTDVIKCAILDDTVTPTAADATPSLDDYTEVGTAGSYTAGGVSLGTWADFITQSGAVTKYDSATDPSWTQDASNDVDAYWALIYNSTDANHRAIGFVDLGGPVDMTAGPLSIAWNAGGILTSTIT